MKYEVKESDEQRGDHLAVKEVFSVLFSGPKTKQRADAYAACRNGQLEVAGEQFCIGDRAAGLS
jgi:hypothetical protein